MAPAKPCTKTALPTRSKKKYALTIIQALVADMTWISNSDRGESHAFCSVYNSHFSVAAGGKHDAIGHVAKSSIWNYVKPHPEQYDV